MAAFLLIAIAAFLLLLLSITVQLLEPPFAWLEKYKLILGYSILGIIVAIFSAARVICEAVLLRQHRLASINRLLVVSVVANPLLALMLWRLGFINEGLNIALLLAYLLQFTYCFFLLPDFLKIRLRSRLAWKTLFKYKSYPLLLSSTSVLDSVTASLPIIVGVAGQSALTVGNYALMQRVFLLPINVMTNAVAKSYLSHSAPKYRDSPQSFFRYTLRLIIALSLFASLATLFVVLLGGPLLSRLVSSEWKQAFMIFNVLAPSIICKFVASSVSSSLLTTASKHLLVFWKFLAFASTYFSLSFAMRMNYYEFFKVLMVNDTAIYLILLVMILYACRPKTKAVNCLNY